MLSYIASNSTANLINNICKEDGVTILNQEVEEIDFLKYIKQTKVNFNLIKYLIIELSQLKNTEDEVINSVKYFREMYVNTRIIIVAKGYDNQNVILTNLYEIGIYNIINALDEQQIKEEIKKCLSEEGLHAKDSRRFKKIEEEKVDKKSKCQNFIVKLKERFIRKNKKEKLNKNIETQDQINSSVYFFYLLVETMTRLIKLIGYVILFTLTSIGITILLNSELRNIAFQILGLK